MESNRFDRLTKALASWSSRRTVLSGITGAAAAVLVPRSKPVRADEASDPDDCILPDQLTVGNHDAIHQISEDILSRLQDLGIDASYFVADEGNPDCPSGNKVQFEEFFSIVKCVLTQARDSANPELEYPALVREMRGLFATFSTAYLAAAGPSGVRIPPSTVVNFPPSIGRPQDGIPEACMAMADTTAASDATPPSDDSCDRFKCVFDLLGIAERCKSDCTGLSGGDLQACYYYCNAQFFAQMFNGAPLPPGYEDVKDCLKKLVTSCDGHCCLHGCCPTFC